MVTLLGLTSRKLGCSSEVEQGIVNPLVAGSIPAVPANVETRICKDCKEEKPLNKEHFYRYTAHLNKNHLSWRCILCYRAKARVNAKERYAKYKMRNGVVVARLPLAQKILVRPQVPQQVGRPSVTFTFCVRCGRKVFDTYSRSLCLTKKECGIYN